MFGYGVDGLWDQPFAIPDEAAIETFRDLRSGCCFAFTVWDKPRPGEKFGNVFFAIDALGTPNITFPYATQYFRFAEEHADLDVFGSAGFIGTCTELSPQYWCHTTLDQVFDVFNNGADHVTDMLRS